MLTESQFGFRFGYSTIDAVFALMGIAKIKRKLRKKLYACFIDLTAAFDLIDRKKLMDKLEKIGLSTKIINVIGDMYTETKMQIWDGKRRSRQYQVNKGVKQGCILSPLLFALFMNDINEHLNGGVCIGPEGKKVTIKVIMYADDIVIIAESSDMMKMMLNRMYSYLDKNNLQININKTKIMIFNKPPGRIPKTDSFYRNGKEIERVSEYKYLGILVRQDLSFNRNNAERSKQAKRAIATTWRKVISNDQIAEEVKNGIYSAAVESIIMYGAEIWGSEVYKEVEGVKNYYWKRLMKMPTYTPNYMIYTELGERSIYEKTLKRSNTYNLKIMMASKNNKYIVQVANEMNRYRCGFEEQIRQMCTEMEVQIEEQDLKDVKVVKDITGMYEKFKEKSFEIEETRKARQSGNRLLYPTLNYLPAYRSLDIALADKTEMWKARSEMVGLGWSPFVKQVETCGYCKKKLRPDGVHIYAKCESMKEIRLKVWNTEYLKLEDIRAALNNSHENVIAYVRELRQFDAERQNF